MRAADDQDEGRLDEGHNKAFVLDEIVDYVDIRDTRSDQGSACQKDGYAHVTRIVDQRQRNLLVPL